MRLNFRRPANTDMWLDEEAQEEKSGPMRRLRKRKVADEEAQEKKSGPMRGLRKRKVAQ
jgi:hypothetical protein